ncbi:hypothetical protein [Rubeoparvulum massiliense]|uniref:hypothetical protein n=1 Tax=Rubeoparvulum massiliense TaxID=1631346 RepID=UPI00065DE19C|nr:hypothetical protein [Rubeoparvulum massiliense]
MTLQRKLRAYARQDQNVQEWLTKNRSWVDANQHSLQAIFTHPEKEQRFIQTIRGKNPQQQLMRLARSSVVEQGSARKRRRNQLHKTPTESRRSRSTSKMTENVKKQEKGSLFSRLPLGKLNLSNLINTVRHVNQILNTVNDLRGSIPPELIKGLLEQKAKKG